MSTKTNANAHAIISNMNKFKIGDGYTYKDICMICKIKEYKSGSNSRNKQMGTFNEPCRPNSPDSDQRACRHLCQPYLLARYYGA